jgi:hypothetical protein
MTSRGTGNKPNTCAGCKLPIVRQATALYRCSFHSLSFTLDNGISCQPCGTVYHSGCIRLGLPFQTRLRNNKGLAFPSKMDLPSFICEACTVRAHLGRELLWQGSDFKLLALERARLIDMAHSWAAGTHDRYRVYHKFLRTFEKHHGVSLLVPSQLSAPPTDPAIAIMWAQEAYSLRLGRSRTDPTALVSQTTVRGLRSAVSQFYSWDFHVAHPSRATSDAAGGPILHDGFLPSNSLGYSFLAKGMSARRGDSSVPSLALLHRHVAWIDGHLDASFCSATTMEARREFALAGLANCGAWMAWLRGGELFGLEWAGVRVIEPEMASAHDLPTGTGAVQWNLLPETKTNRTSVADVVMAYSSSAGLSVGKWLHRLRASMGLDDFPTTPTPVFVHEDGRPWTSHYFRTHYLIPLLDIQRRQGDPFLAQYDGSKPGKSLADVFYSMHSYRRGARSHVAVKRAGCIRKARPEEVNKHGRWRRVRSNLPMAILYLASSLRDRVAITRYCM